MPQLQLTDVQSTNLHLLQVIRLGIELDRVDSCCRFALSAALADHLQMLSLGQLWSVVAHVGQNTLFPPRQDLLNILQAPGPLEGPLAAARPARPALPSTRL